MLQHILDIYVVGCLASIIPTMFLMYTHYKSEGRINIVMYLLNIILSWAFLIPFLYININLLRKEKKQKSVERIAEKLKTMSKEEIAASDDCTGFLNFSISVRVENGKEVLLNQPLVYMLCQYMKDYGFMPKDCDEKLLKVIIRLPTGSEATFPYATKEQIK